MPKGLTPTSVTIVVPCYNEYARLDSAAFLELARDGGPALLFVDDGSRDHTAQRLAELAAREPARIATLRLERNLGKAEAVRRGLIAALAGRPDVVGYLDADLATPVSEVRRLIQVLAGAPGIDVILASRVLLLGRQIERRPLRHYVGRVFATAASLLLRLPVYDTQCGAKLFRRTTELEAAVAEPFLSRWMFDVELLGRLLIGTSHVPPLPVSRIFEEPLQTWRDIPGSKIRLHQVALVPSDLVRIALDLRGRRALRGC